MAEGKPQGGCGRSLCRRERSRLRSRQHYGVGIETGQHRSAANDSPNHHVIVYRQPPERPGTDERPRKVHDKVAGKGQKRRKDYADDKTGGDSGGKRHAMAATQGGLPLPYELDGLQIVLQPRQELPVGRKVRTITVKQRFKFIFFHNKTLFYDSDGVSRPRRWLRPRERCWRTASGDAPVMSATSLTEYPSI